MIAIMSGLSYLNSIGIKWLILGIIADFFSTIRMGNSTISFPDNGPTTFSKVLRMESQKKTISNHILMIS